MAAIDERFLKIMSVRFNLSEVSVDQMDPDAVESTVNGRFELLANCPPDYYYFLGGDESDRDQQQAVISPSTYWCGF